MLQRLCSIDWKFKLILVGAIAVGSVAGWQVGRQQLVTLLAIDTHTGTLQWFQPLKSVDEVYSRGAIAAGGTVILESAESSTPDQRFDTYRLQAFATQTGKQLWTQQLNAPAGDEMSGFGYFLAANSIIDLQPTALYLQAGEELRSLDPTTGEQRWTIDRPWFNTRPMADLWIALGIAATEQKLAVLQLNPQPQQIQILDAATGNILQQTPVPSTDVMTNFSRMKPTHDHVVTAGPLQAEDDSLDNDDQSTVTAYSMDTGQVRFRAQFRSHINNLQTTASTLQLSTDRVYAEQPDRQVDGQVIALDSQTGQILWQQSQSQLECFSFYSTWQVDAQSVYLNCNRRRNGEDSSTIVALSAQTGQTQWQSLISSNWHSRHVPIAISDRQLLTFRQVRQDDRNQIQAVALDRQTGAMLWTVALFDRRYVDTFRSRVAIDGDRVFILDAVPRWQLWLLQLNRRWYLKRSIARKDNTIQLTRSLFTSRDKPVSIKGKATNEC
ncbi:PQQ-binding-like beta-propeller repeat protein [Oculatella sp. LEGE 06141]|uniref:outer membrane protein assembly factor BamB family protein n=1 Tax=Oculatella sp. LEGE 06141 TaxID=1828648 RepID=UPI00187E3FAB|nr:PQQ-binding-like beta-propeller repeat protein [Oculatella sp. LEGE 06141]MBE9181179.1 PQQ-binding-like beta-propeller repeat protein [Oculatella sp. LEGE 06141]